MDLMDIFGKVLFTAAVTSIKDLVIAAVKARANLTRANLYRANLYGANLCGANLCGANLCGANLCGANNIKLSSIQNAQLSIPPIEGAFIAWKKCRGNVIVKLLIPKSARRSNATSRKCRAEKVKVLQVIGAEIGISIHDSKTEYRKGAIVICDNWNENRWVECGGGIHFFINKIEAEEYN